MILGPTWYPTGMTWWEAVLWTLLELALFFGVPLGLVAASGPLRGLGQRIALTWQRRHRRPPVVRVHRESEESPDEQG